MTETDISSVLPSAHTQLSALIARFGSRRALIEELDRRTRLKLLKPLPGTSRGRDPKDYERGYSPKIRNEPNPQWRELDSPSLLFSGEKIEFPVPASSLKYLKPVNLISTNPRKYKSRTGTCKSCGCKYSERTINCGTCHSRHSYRRTRYVV